MDRRVSWLLLACLSLVVGTAQGALVETVLLKNGSELKGYIKEMNLSGGFVMATEQAVICLKGDDVTISGEQRVPLDRLDKAWAEWAEENDAFAGEGTDRSLTLHDVHVTGGKSVSGVRILEKGVMVRYLELAKNEYDIDWGDVVSIRGEKRRKDALSGVDCIYQTVRGEQYEGQYAGKTRNTLSLYLYNGIIQTFFTLDVVRYTYIPINPNQSLFEQSALLDIIITKDNAESKGIIVEENYSSNDDNVNYVILKDEDGGEHKFMVAEIAKVRKVENGAYDPKFDIVLHEGDVMVNREPVEAADIADGDDGYHIDYMGQIVTLEGGTGGMTRIIVEYRDINYQGEEKFQLVKANGVNPDDGELMFSFKDLASSLYSPESVEISFNHTTKAEYVVEGKGLFVLYDAENNRAIPVIVQ